MLATAFNIPNSIGFGQTIGGENLGGAWTTQPSNYQVPFTTQSLTATNLNTVVDPYAGISRNPLLSSEIGGQFISMPVISNSIFPLQGNLNSVLGGQFAGLTGCGTYAPTNGSMGYTLPTVGGVAPLAGQFTPFAGNGFGFNPFVGGLNNAASPFGLSQQFNGLPAQQLGMFAGMPVNGLGFGGNTLPVGTCYTNLGTETVIEVSSPVTSFFNCEIVILGNELRIRTVAQRAGMDISRPFYSVILPTQADIARIQTVITPNGGLTIRVPHLGNVLGNINTVRVS